MRRVLLVRVSLLLVLLIGNLAFGISYAGGQETTTIVEGRVLMISAYSPGYETFYGQVDGIRAAFEGHNIQFDLEFMDTKRFYDPENLEKFHDYLKFKLERLDAYDVILVADDNALDFVVENKEDLFASQPVVFLGINNVNKAIEIGQRDDFTGVMEEATIRETIDLGQSLQADASRVVLITDGTNTATSVKKRYESQSYHFPTLSFEELDLSQYTFSEMDEIVKTFTSEDIVLLSSALRDKNQVSITFKVALERLLENCDQPIYHLYEFGLGDGILGGHMVRYFSQGEEAAKIAVRILGGEDVSTIPLVENANRYMIDYDVFTSFGLDEDLAPSETIWINRDVGLWEAYYPYIIATILVLLLQGAFIISLQLNVRKRKIAEVGLIDSKNEIQMSNEELTASNEELRATNEALEASYEEIESQREKIYNLIYVDPLTNLKNRHGITESITNTIKSDFTDEKMAVMFLDVDNFKDINDTFGHDVGDKAIKETGTRLMRIQSDSIQVGRFGGDEFLIFVKGNDQVERLEEIVADIRSCFSGLIMVDEKSFFLTVSLGIALYPEHAKTKKNLIKKADMALYEAKFSGKNKYVIYERHMDKSLEDKVLFQTLVREGFENKEFFLNYQPYFDVITNRVSGFESLIRWENETLGSVSPYHLITTAEEMGLIIELGEWIFRESCKFAKKVNETSDYDYKVSVNISAVQIVKVDFYSIAVQVVEEIGIDPSLIILEMTETVLIQSFESTKSQIQKLKDYGFELALDDFGTGYSSLSYFKNIPAAILKIDKSFVDHMATDDYDKYTVEAIINLAHYNGVKVTAEGVELEEQVNLLNGMLCDVIQGYYYSKPLSEENALALIKD